MKNKRMLNRLIVLVAVCLGYSLQAEARTYGLHKLSKAPNIDGHHNEPVWEAIRWTGGFVNLKTKKPPLKASRFKGGYTNDGIYFLIQCDEPNPKFMKVAHPDNGAVWSDDNVEIFICPEKTSVYYHFVLNAKGFRFNAKCVFMGKQNNKILWSWTGKARVTPKYWMAEVCIPFADVESAPESVTQKWKFNLARHSTTGKGEYTTWISLHSRFHEPWHFADMAFSFLKDADMKKMQENVKGPMTQKKFEEVLTNVKLQVDTWNKSNDSLDKMFLKKWGTKVKDIMACAADKNLDEKLDWKSLKRKLEFLRQCHRRMDTAYGHKLRMELLNEMLE